jgi:hypothetical protein
MKVIGHKEHNGRLVWTNLTQTSQFRWVTEQLLDAIGVPEDAGDISAPWLQDRTVWAILNARKGEDGRWFNNVKRYLTPEQADIELEQAANDNGTDEDVDIVPSKKSSRSAPAKVGKQPVVAEMEDQEDVPF